MVTFLTIWSPTKDLMTGNGESLDGSSLPVVHYDLESTICITPIGEWFMTGRSSMDSVLLFLSIFKEWFRTRIGEVVQLGRSLKTHHMNLLCEDDFQIL